MKKLAVLCCVLGLGIFTMLLEKDTKKKKKKRVLDPESTGPHGEPVIIGSNGGKYYFKNDRKVYISHKNKN